MLSEECILRFPPLENFSLVLKWSCLILLYHILFSDTNLISKSVVVAASEIDKVYTYEWIIQSDSDLIDNSFIYNIFLSLPAPSYFALLLPYPRLTPKLWTFCTSFPLVDTEFHHFATPPWTFASLLLSWTNCLMDRLKKTFHDWQVCHPFINKLIMDKFHFGKIVTRGTCSHVNQLYRISFFLLSVTSTDRNFFIL